MSPRFTDWSIALAALLAFTTGVVSLVSGLPQDWTIFMLHGIGGLGITAAIALHMFARAKWLRKRDIAGRRQALYFSALLLAGVALWPGQQLTQRILNLPGARRRFTGSREMASYAGNVFPTTSWVADA